VLVTPHVSPFWNADALGAAMARRASVYRIMMVVKFVSEDGINCCIQKFYAMTGEGGKESNLWICQNTTITITIS
jgi:hypothetical protein